MAETDRGTGHRRRLRERFSELGIDGLSDEEILEILLAFGTPRSDTKLQAREALQRFGSLAAVLDASSVELRQIKGIGPTNSFALAFVQGAARRYLKRRLAQKNYLHSPAAVREYLQHLFQGQERELLVAVFLDSGHGIIDAQVMAEGTINANVVYPREIVKAALAKNAAAMVVAHNHPSGRTEPSAEDRHLTRVLFMACATLQLRLLDHLVVGGPAFYSFAEAGTMAEIQREWDTIFRG